MNLSDVVAASGGHVLAEIGLVLFVAIFAGACAYAFSRRNRETFERARSAPLDDGRIVEPPEVRHG